ncbi:MAG TPA: hypothetical protein PKD24_06205 [Pyrinomonadaceae bacterium]|nr:hypothetical protein [Pyrinomonadaceae bacterium]HMP65251.1 hypothetical protein [Pyrinomonadaceae bacterium]
MRDLGAPGTRIGSPNVSFGSPDIELIAFGGTNGLGGPSGRQIADDQSARRGIGMVDF